MQIVSLAILALQSKGPETRVYGAVESSAALSRFGFAVMYGMTFLSPHVGDEYRSHVLAHLGQNLFSMGLYLAAAFVGGWKTIDGDSGDDGSKEEEDEMAEITLKVSVLMMAASVSEVFLGSVRALVLSEDQKVSVSQHYIKTRLGMFVMIVLGESIIQLVANTDVSSAYDLGVCVCYVIIVFCMASLYFDNQPVLASQHAMKHGTMKGLLYIYTHPLLAYCILVFGVAIKRMPMKPDEINLVSSSFGMSLVFINVIRATHAHGEIIGSPFLSQSLRVRVRVGVRVRVRVRLKG